MVCLLFFAADGLQKGKEYEFRVRGKNLAGIGEPSQPSASVVVRAKPCKNCSEFSSFRS